MINILLSEGGGCYRYNSITIVHQLVHPFPCKYVNQLASYKWTARVHHTYVYNHRNILYIADYSHIAINILHTHQCYVHTRQGTLQWQGTGGPFCSSARSVELPKDQQWPQLGLMEQAPPVMLAHPPWGMLTSWGGRMTWSIWGLFHSKGSQTSPKLGERVLEGGGVG